MHYRSFTEAVQDDKRSGSVIEDNKIQMLKNIFTPRLKHFDREIRGKWYIMRSKNAKCPRRKFIGAGVKKIAYWSGTVLISLIIGFSLQIVLAAWNAPPSAPPAGNLPYPLNTSTNNQIKAGALGIGGLFQTDGNTYLATSTGNVGIGTTTPPEKLTLDGGNFLQSASSSPKRIGMVQISEEGEYGARSVYISGKYAYVVSSSYGAMAIIDVSNPYSPKIISQILIDGLVDVYVAGQYAYVTSFANNALIIINISNPFSPQITGQILGSSNYLLGAWGVYVSGKYAYVTGYNNNALVIIDVSNPSLPKRVGQILNTAEPLLYNPRGIYISGQYAYVACYGSDTMLIINVSNPFLPQKAGEISGGSNFLDQIEDVYVSGRYAYVVSSLSNALVIIDISQPSLPNKIGKISPPEESNLDGAGSVYVSGRYAYVTSSGSSSFVVIDISDSSFPRKVGEILGAGEFLSGAIGVYVSGKYAYVASFVNNALVILDISGIDAPTASIGNISASQINVSDNMDIGNNLYIRNGLNVGPGGIKSDGVIQATSTESVSSLILRGVSAPPAVCALGNKGIIYYESNLNIYCYCDGSSWQKLNSPGGACP